MQRRDLYNRKYLLIAILVIAALLRFHQIGQPFIDGVSWRQTDNATIADNFYRGNGNIFYPEISWNGPGHNYVGYEFQTITYLAALFYRIFGQHDWIGRCIAIAFSLWGIFVFYQLVRRVWTNNHALLSAAVLAIMPGEVFVGRSFLAEPVMLSLVVTSFWLLTVYLQTDRLRYLLLASLAGMLGFLTKISGIFIAIPMLYTTIAILKQKQKLNPQQLIRLSVAAIATLIPVAAYYLWAVHISCTYPPYYMAAGQYWVWKYGLSFFLEQYYFLPRLYQHLNWFWTKPLMLFIIAGLFFYPPRSRNLPASEKEAGNNGKAPWLFHWWVLAFAIYYFIAAQGLVNNPTNLNLVNPAAAALAANVLIVSASFVERKIRLPLAAVLITAVMLFFAWAGYKARPGIYYSWGEKEYRLGLALRQASQPGDLVITATPTEGSTVAIYYSQRRGWPFPPAYTWATLVIADKDADTAIALLEELSAKGAQWFGIIDEQRIRFVKDKPKLVEYLESKWEHYYENPDFIIYRLPSKK